jgi:uncharacterized protein (DUF1697 family)
VPTHVALLRAVNVGGVKVTMTELRALAESLGHRDVATYIQSGNLLFTPGPGSGDAASLAAALSAAIEDSLHVRSAVIVLSRDELAEVARANPYPVAPEPRFVHVVFLPAELDDSAAATVAAIVGRYGGTDKATLRGRALYLHTPAGYGTSELAKALLGKRSPVAAGTARNWSTVTKLLELCGADEG